MVAINKENCGAYVKFNGDSVCAVRFGQEFSSSSDCKLTQGVNKRCVADDFGGLDSSTVRGNMQKVEASYPKVRIPALHANDNKIFTEARILADQYRSDSGRNGLKEIAELLTDHWGLKVPLAGAMAQVIPEIMLRLRDEFRVEEVCQADQKNRRVRIRRKHGLGG